MNFINPKTDFAFKKIFGSDQSKPILKSFLNALLYDEQPIIEDLEILNPYLVPKIEGMKDTYVDVRAVLKGGRRVIIEMQVLNVEGFEKRILYNAAKSYSDQLDQGEDYPSLSPVVALTITDFVMFPEHKEVKSVYLLKEKERLTDYREGDIELVFVELPKFTKTLDELKGVMEKWLYFLRKAPSLELAPGSMTAVPEIDRAFDIANRANLSREEKEIQDSKLTFLRDQRGAINLAGKKGNEEGRAEGEHLKALAIARRMLTAMSDQAIAEFTELPLATIAELRAKS